VGVTLQSAIDAELPFLRAEAEARMQSTCTVRRKTGQMVQNETTGEEVPEWEAVHTDLPFRLIHGRSRTVTIGGVEFEEATARGDMPSDTTDLADGDLIEVTAGEWADTVWRIVEAVKGDQMTARRVPVVEVARPSEWDA
jgi:hypothetical protein